MSEHNTLARKPNPETAEEDPLEELARIVSGGLDEFNPAGKHAGNTETEKHDSVEEAAADMEAELLRGLSGGLDEAELAPGQAVEETPEPAPEPEPVRTYDSSKIAPEAGGLESFSLEDQLMAELDAGGADLSHRPAEFEDVVDEAGIAEGANSAIADAQLPDTGHDGKSGEKAVADTNTPASRGNAPKDPYVRQRKDNLESGHDADQGDATVRPVEDDRHSAAVSESGTAPATEFAQAAENTKGRPTRSMATPTLPRSEAPRNREDEQVRQNPAAAETDRPAPWPGDVARQYPGESRPPEISQEQDFSSSGQDTQYATPRFGDLDLSEAFRAELEQIESGMAKKSRLTTDAPNPQQYQNTEVEEEPSETGGQRLEEEFAKAFERELQLGAAGAKQLKEPAEAEPMEEPARPSGEPARAANAGENDLADNQAEWPTDDDHTAAWSANDDHTEESEPMRDVQPHEIADASDALLDVEWLSEIEAAEEAGLVDDREPVAAGRRRGGFAMAAMALLIAVVVGAGVIGYGLLNRGDGSATDAPVIRADSDPVKMKPSDPGGTTIENQDKASYERVTGEFASETRQELLLKTTEEPVDLSTLTPQAGTGSTSAQAASQIAPGSDSKAEERLSPSSLSQSASETSLLAPRRVRTVTVKPDGTIVAPSTTNSVGANSLQPQQSAPVAATGNAVAADGTIDGARSTGAIAIPTPRPDLGVDSAATDTTAPAQTASVTSPPVGASTTAAQTASISSGGKAAVQAGRTDWAVQVASRRTAEDAQSTFQVMQRDYPDIMKDRQMSVQRAEIEGRGVFFRVRVMGETRDDAIKLCTRLKSAGGSCFVTR